ncbi:hydroxymethylbilane synthase [Chlamydiales bacterium]|nr:hydroxymethylbilane synthase [Chlamydiales bacterium]
MSLILGTRGSKLALKQADIVQKELLKQFPTLLITIKIIQTSGDKDLISPISEIGGKGVFIKELEVALQNHEIDVAVHSLKDMTADLAPGMKIETFLTSEASNDCVLFSSPKKTLRDLPKGSLVGTGSMRRKALLKKLYPHLKTVNVRGNVLTRIDKLHKKQFDALLLSEAGIIRLGLDHLVGERLDPKTFYPAPGQGVIALEVGENEHKTHAINDLNQSIKSSMEIAFLKKMGLDCSSPLGTYTSLKNDKISLHGFIANESMTHYFEKSIQSSIDQRIDAAEELAENFIQWIKQNP